MEKKSLNLSWDKFFVMVIYGTPGSGKTSLLKYIMYEASNNKRFDHCLLISSSKNDPDYKFISKKYKFDSYNRDAVENYIHFLRDHNQKNIKTRGLLIFDDVVGQDAGSFKTNFYKDLFTCHRHIGLSIIICMQVPVEIPAYLRSMIKYACIYKYISKGDKEKIFTAFGSLAENEKEFNKIYEHHTNEPYKFLFYNRTDMYDTDKAYKGCRAPNPKDIPKFKIKFD